MKHDVVKYHLFRHIPEVHTVKYHITLKRLVLNASVSLMGVLPSPLSGSLLTLNKLSVLFLCVYKSNVSVVGFRSFIHHLEDSFRTRKCHNDGIELL